MAPREPVTPGRKPVEFFRVLHSGEIRSSAFAGKVAVNAMRPDMNYGLGVARVINVNYEEFFVTLRIVGGGTEVSRVPIPITFPGAGARHFFGAMPCIGDYCIVGWMPQESGSDSRGGTKTPVILSWVIPGTWTGREWLTPSAFAEDEFDLANHQNRALVQGVYDRIRHKLRHAGPGDIVASSARGSDLVLDESVTLANRRGNEMRLRDQDQAFVVRSLQQFHAMAGVRVYAGMIQRDATLLATSMVSDGVSWDNVSETYNGESLTEDELPTTDDLGRLTPARALERSTQPDGSLGRAFLTVPPRLDPYQFLQNGLYLDGNGFVITPDHLPEYQADAVYGGKGIYRVAVDKAANATLKPNEPALTEYRLEFMHTADGRLPVTEQTDGFDAERLPDSPSGDTNTKQKRPFIELVYGTAVGNDAFSTYGRQRYALPLSATIFDEDTANPRLDPIVLLPEDSDELIAPLGDQLAMLFRLIPPVSGDAGKDTFWAVNKRGQVRAYISGPENDNSVEMATAGGMKLGFGGPLQLLLGGGIEFKSLSKATMRFESEGCLHLTGNGPSKGPDALGERVGGSGGGESDLPSVHVKGRTNVWVEAEKFLFLKGGKARLESSSTVVRGHSNVEVSGGDLVAISAKTITTNSSGKRVDSFGGPKDALPSSGPLHEKTYTPTYPCTVEKTLYTLGGSREENFQKGDHTSTFLIGNMTYETKVGKWKAKAGQNTLELGMSGLSASIQAGTISMNAPSGTATISAGTAVTLSATGGTATIKGTSISLAAPIVGQDSGPVLCAGSREPFTGLPFSALGTVGAANVRVGA